MTAGTIRFLEPELKPESQLVEYQGGPFAGRRETLTGGLPSSIKAEFGPSEAEGFGCGVYVKSVRCAEDLVWRYIWREQPPQSDSAPGRLSRP